MMLHTENKIMSESSNPLFTRLGIQPPAITAAQMQNEVIQGMLSGKATFEAMEKAIRLLAQSAPPENDVIIIAFNVSVKNVEYIDPHTFVFDGLNHEGQRTLAICHFSQLVSHAICRLKAVAAEARIITGFSKTDQH